jgi:hypothetical protein
MSTRAPSVVVAVFGLAVATFLASTVAPSAAHAAATATVQNDKWAGYGVYGLSKTDGAPGAPPSVRGSWTMPTVECPGHTRSLSAMWIGLSGAGDNAPLEQIGTTSSCDGAGRAVYGVAYQEVNTPEWSGVARQIDSGKYPVSAGDTMIAAVLYTADGRYEYDLRDETQGWLFTAQEPGSSRIDAYDAALWIVEAPSVGMAQASAVQELTDFGTAEFVGCFTSLGPFTAAGHSALLTFELSKSSFFNKHTALPTPFTESPVPGSSATGSNFSVNWTA